MDLEQLKNGIKSLHKSILNSLSEEDRVKFEKEFSKKVEEEKINNPTIKDFYKEIYNADSSRSN